MKLSDKITSLEQFLAVKAPGNPVTDYYRTSDKMFYYLPASFPVIINNTGDRLGLRVAYTDYAPEHMWWAVREFLRQLHGVYKPATSVLDWLADHSSSPGFPVCHYVHISTEDDSLIAFTPDEQSGVADKQVRMTLGRYLKKYIVGISDAQVQALEAAHRADLSGEFELVTGQDIAKAYIEAGQSGVGSCMSHDTTHWGTGDKKLHPAMAYDAPGFGLALLRNHAGKLSARCLTWANPDNAGDKRMIRVYGDTMLERRLLRAGYVYKGLAGARLRLYDLATRDNPHRVLMPYIDGLRGSQSDGTVNVVRRSDGLHMITHEQRLTITKLANAVDIVDKISTQTKSTGGYAELRILPDNLGMFTCAINGREYSAADVVAEWYVASATGELAKVAAVNCTGLRRARFRGPAGFVTAVIAADVPVFDHRGEDIVESAEHRRYLGYVKLDRRYYPDEPDNYVLKGDLVVARDVLPDGRIPHETSGNSWVRAADRVAVVALDEDNKPYIAQVHKQNIHASWVRVADRDSAHLWASIGVKVAVTDTKRRVVLGVHDVVTLIDGSVTYSRNAVTCQVFGRYVWMRKEEANASFNTPRLARDADVLGEAISGYALSELPSVLRDWWASYIGRRFYVAGGGTTIIRGSNYESQDALREALQGFGEGCTAAMIVERWPGTTPSVANALANNVHNLALVSSMVAQADAALEARKAALRSLPSVTRESLSVGDRVVVSRRYERGIDGLWENSWVRAMDAWVGQTAVVSSLDPDQVHLRLDGDASVSGRMTYAFPYSCLRRAGGEQPAAEQPIAVAA